jgi:N-acetylmuramoyl-L-alanine amidase
MLKFPIMKKALIILSILIFSFQADAEDLLKLRASRHPEFLRIVMEGPEYLITKAIVSQKTQNIHVTFPGASFKIYEQKVDVKYRKIGSDAILFSPGSFQGFKAFTLKYPNRLVIDIFQETAAELKKRTGFHKIDSVVIDPGHGGPDYGIVKGEYKEKSVVLDIGTKVNLLAKKNKFNSSLTRASDHLMSLDERVNIAAREGADLFLSLHVGNHKEIIFYVPVVNESYPEKIRPYLASRGQYNYQARTDDLVNAMQNSFSKEFSSEMIIVRPLPYSILSRVEAAALMIELPSFEDASYINEFKTEVARALYKGIYIYEEISTE